MPSGLFGFDLQGSQERLTAPPDEAAQPDSSAPVEDPGAKLVADLISNMVLPGRPEPPKHNSASRVIGTIGKALTTYGAIKNGGTPRGPGAISTHIANEAQLQDRYTKAKTHFDEKEADLINEIARIRFRLAEESHERTMAENAKIRAEGRVDARAIARADTSDKATAKRQRDDDERGAAVELEKWKRNTLYEMNQSLIESGIDGVPNLDPNKMSVTDVMDMSLEMQSLVSGVPPTQEERLRHQDEIIKRLDPTMKRTRVSFTTKDGVPNASYAVDPIQSLTPQDMRIAGAAGIPSFDAEGNARDVRDISADIAAAKKAEKDLKRETQEVRLRALVKKSNLPGGTVGQKVAETLTILQNAEAAISMLSGTSESPGGPLAGRISPGFRYLGLELFKSSKSADLNRQVTIRIQNIFNQVAKIRSGAAVTLPEEIRLVPELPTMTDTKTTMLTKLGLVSEFMGRQLNNLQSRHGLEDGDFNHVSSQLTDSEFIPTEMEAGDVLLFGGDEQ